MPLAAVAHAAGARRTLLASVRGVINREGVLGVFGRAWFNLDKEAKDGIQEVG
jgi:hypothetical protein